MVVKAVANALRKHPKINVDYINDNIRYNDHIHIGVAVAVPEGLVVPVINFTDEKTLPEVGSLVKDYANRARNKKLKPDEMEGVTKQVSLGELMEMTFGRISAESCPSL